MVKYMVTLNSSTGVCRVKQCCTPTATINVGNELGMDRKDIAPEAVVVMFRMAYPRVSY